MFFAPGIEYSCLNKKTGWKHCPWVGKPWSQPSGYYLGSEDMIIAPFGVDTGEQANEVPKLEETGK